MYFLMKELFKNANDSLLFLTIKYNNIPINIFSEEFKYILGIYINVY